MERRSLLQALSILGVAIGGPVRLTHAVGPADPPPSIRLHKQGRLKCFADKGACEFLDFGHRVHLISSTGMRTAVQAPETSSTERYQTRYVDAEQTPDGDVLLLDHGNRRLRRFSALGQHLEDLDLSDSVLSPQGLVLHETGLGISDSQSHRLLFLNRLGEITHSVGQGLELHGAAAMARGNKGDIHLLCPDQGQILIFDHQGRFQTSYGQSVVGPGVQSIALRDSNEVFLLDHWRNTVLSGGPDIPWRTRLALGEQHPVRFRSLSFTNRDELVLSV